VQTIHAKQRISPLLRAVNACGYLNAEHVYGINCQSDDWDDLYKHLNEFGDQAIAGDYSN
jgi:hypothetical protein